MMLVCFDSNVLLFLELGIITGKIINHITQWNVFFWFIKSAAAKHIFKTLDYVDTVIAFFVAGAVLVKVIANLSTATNRNIIVHFNV